MAVAFTDDELSPTPKPTGPSAAPSALARAERDLDWYFSQAGAALGMHGSGFDPGSPVWDQERVDNAMCRLFEAARVTSVRRHYRVSHTLAAVDPELQRVARDLYTPLNYEAVKHCLFLFAAPPFDPRAQGAAGEQATVLGIFHRTSAFQVAYTGPEAGRLRPLDWLSFTCRPRVEKGRSVNSRPPPWIVRARTEAIALRREVVTAFVDAARGLR